MFMNVNAKIKNVVGEEAKYFISHETFLFS